MVAETTCNADSGKFDPIPTLMPLAVYSDVLVRRKVSVPLAPKIIVPLAPGVNFKNVLEPPSLP